MAGCREPANERARRCRAGSCQRASRSPRPAAACCRRGRPSWPRRPSAARAPRWQAWLRRRCRPASLRASQLLPVASAAYETRLALANQAERTLDLQTFVFHADDTGKYLLDALRAAAGRGVRVRLLVDDLNTAGSDEMLAAFAGEPNVEVRLFNPFTVGRSSVAARLLGSLNELGRVNHRMHNKLFVADGSIAVFGGRNTGNEYFMRAAAGNFVDFDVLAAGAVVAELSATFDDYWNSAYAWPVRSIVTGRSPATDAEFRKQFVAVAPPPLDETIPMRLQTYAGTPSELAAGKLSLTGAGAEVEADPTDKVKGSRMRTREGTVRAFVAQVMRSAQYEVFVISPYFVPGELGMEAMRGLRARGVELTLITNSLAATDEPSVHGGYLRYRREMLEIGVQIYELSPTLSQRDGGLGRFGSSQGSLHAKIVAVDRDKLFVGSMNMDARSERYNTELGVLIESAPIAREFLDMIRFKGSAYHLRLENGNGQIQWVAGEGERAQVLSHEPEASWWLQLKARLAGWRGARRLAVNGECAVQKILLKTTIPTTAEDWSIARFSLLAALLAGLHDDAGRLQFMVEARDRSQDAAGDDPDLAGLAGSAFDQLWLFAVDVTGALTPADVAGIDAFRRRGGACMLTRDHADMGSCLSRLPVVGRAHHFHSTTPESELERQARDDPYTLTIDWPNYHSGANGDFQTVAATDPLHAAMRRAEGKAIAEATFHRFADYNWEPAQGAPAFVTEPVGGSLRAHPEAWADTQAYSANIARWLGRTP